MELRRLKNIYNINGTAFLLDATLSKYHDFSANTGLDPEDRSQNIFKLQEHLTQAMAFMMSNDDVYNPFFLVEFNEERAWYA